MKKSDFILLGGVLLVFIIAFFVGSSSKAEEIELPLTLAGDPGVNEISYSDYEKLIEEDAAFLVVIEQDGCSYCQMYMPVVEAVAGEYQIPIMDLNLANISSEEHEKLSTSNKYLKTQQWGTPTTLLLKGSTVVDSIGGYVEEETFEEFIKENVKISE